MTDQFLPKFLKSSTWAKLELYASAGSVARLFGFQKEVADAISAHFGVKNDVAAAKVLRILMQGAGLSRPAEVTLAQVQPFFDDDVLVGIAGDVYPDKIIKAINTTNFTSIDQLEQTLDSWLLADEQSGPTGKNVQQTVPAEASGYNWYKLDKKYLAEHAAKMKICTRFRGEVWGLYNGNNPEITVDVYGQAILEARGIDNIPPTPQQAQMIVNFAKQNNLKLSPELGDTITSLATEQYPELLGGINADKVIADHLSGKAKIRLERLDNDSVIEILKRDSAPADILLGGLSRLPSDVLSDEEYAALKARPTFPAAQIENAWNTFVNSGAPPKNELAQWALKSTFIPDGSQISKIYDANLRADDIRELSKLDPHEHIYRMNMLAALIEQPTAPAEMIDHALWSSMEFFDMAYSNKYYGQAIDALADSVAGLLEIGISNEALPIDMARDLSYKADGIHPKLSDAAYQALLDKRL